MRSKYEAIDVSGLRTIPISERASKVRVDDFATAWEPGAGFPAFLDSLPNILAGQGVRQVIDRLASAARLCKPVVFAMGAHVIKCGLSPIVIDLIRRGVITCVAVNGAGAIHDSEIAFYGETSEDVVSGMRNGTFGMARETSEFLNGSAGEARDTACGFGETLGRKLLDAHATHVDKSILASAHECNVPVTVHACIGCDIVHMHPDADGAAIGAASMTDFRILTHAMRDLGGGGILMNVGSAVVLPEVLLKAMTTLINLGHDLTGMFGVNLDFVQHYRSNQQVVARVKEIGGDGIALTGHHEIMLPLVAAGVAEALR